VGDSFSSDLTLKIIIDEYPEVDIVHIEFTTFANKMNELKDSTLVRNKWVMRLDADEYVINPEFFFSVVSPIISNENSNVCGLFINRRYYFLGTWIKYGGMYPLFSMRIFDRTLSSFELKSVDEKILLNGGSEYVEIDIADDCNRGIMHIIKKHIKYAKGEAIDYINLNLYNNKNLYKIDFDNIAHNNKKSYYNSPIFIRPFVYFFYRFIYKLGFLDGPKGCIYHFLHAFIYRELVDIYIIKLKFFR
jgi:hypothetical protein